jgi:hypothetical protein
MIYILVPVRYCTGRTSSIDNFKLWHVGSSQKSTLRSDDRSIASRILSPFVRPVHNDLRQTDLKARLEVSSSFVLLSFKIPNEKLGRTRARPSKHCIGKVRILLLVIRYRLTSLPQSSRTFTRLYFSKPIDGRS